MPVKKLIGERIYLGPITQDHVPVLVRWMNDLEVTKYLTTSPMRLTEDIEKEWIKKVLKDPNHHYYGIFLDDALIGGISLKDVDQVQRRATLGVVIGEKEHWNKGYGTEAIQLLLDYAFNVLNLNNIMLSYFEYNKRAARVYEKIGFKKIGKRRQSRFFDGVYHDEVYMDILAEEWK